MYELRFFFDYGGTCLWAANGAAHERFGYPVDLADLPIGDDVRTDMARACERFDSSLNWSDPVGPSLWSDQDWEQFKVATDELLEKVRAALGPNFKVRDERQIGCKPIR